MSYQEFHNMKKDGYKLEGLNQMIRQINKTELEACERLSNHCCRWDGKEQKVKMAA